MNRLVHEPSPYLRQHADNPVDWWPWSDEAFAQAAAEDKPVFLSIGYATCHWCHVMAHESFEDPEIARHLNGAFVCVKVDREERPDVDALYMAVCQMATGHGGWPLTVVLTPDRRPFYVGTYFPPRSRHGRAGVVDLCAALTHAWTTRRADVEAAADDLTGAALALFAPPPPGGPVPTLGADTLEKADAALLRRYDAEHGGFGTQPKFPTPHVLAYLWQRAQRTGRRDLRHAVDGTLEAMQRGGIHDHVGGGFHRYATDRAWRLPHFEKMLYDQVGLLPLYARTLSAEQERTALGIAGYVQERLRAPDGLFYCAEDADSARPDGSMHEGAFYTWTLEEVRARLGEADAVLFAETYTFAPEGNFEDEATREKTGENVLYLNAFLEALTPAGMDDESFRQHVEALREDLKAAREARPRPLLDDKCLADWNGYAASGLLRAARNGPPGWADVQPEGTGSGSVSDRLRALALPALLHDRSPFVQPGGTRLWHRRHGETVGVEGFVDDYVFSVRALLDALEGPHGVDADVLERALFWMDAAVEGFWDPARGLFTTARRDATGLVAAPADRTDGAMPSANAVALSCLVDLDWLVGRADLGRLAERMLEAAAPEIAARPDAYCAWLSTLDRLVHGSLEVVLTPAGGDTPVLAFDRAARSASSDPDAGATPRLYTIRPSEREALARIAPTLAAYPAPEEGVFAYVCKNFACEAPVDTPEALRALLLRR